MKRYSLTHLSDAVLCRELSTVAANENEATAELIAHIAEFDARKLYLPAAYPTMFAYCTGELGLSEDATAKRLQVARVSRKCPGVLEALAQGLVHLSGLVLLAPHLTPETVDELLAAAAHKRKAEIESLLAERCPKLDVPASAEPIAAAPVSPCAGSHAPGHVEMTGSSATESSPGTPNQRARVSPLSAEAFAVQFTRSREADQRFRYVQDLLGHQVATNDIAEVYDRAVRELIARLERTKFAATDRPRRAARITSGSRNISAHVMRAVWQRDAGQCTFVSASGRRCEARRGLEYDHKTEFARGGEATVDGIQLRCRGHNQHTAERTFGAGFMARKRKEAAEARAAAKAARAKAREEKEAESRLLPHEEEVIPWLRQLGCQKDESRIAARRCRDMAEASLEDRVKRALSWFGARIARTVRPVAPEVCPSVAS